MSPKHRQEKLQLQASAHVCPGQPTCSVGPNVFRLITCKTLDHNDPAMATAFAQEPDQNTNTTTVYPRRLIVYASEIELDVVVTSLKFCIPFQHHVCDAISLKSEQATVASELRVTLFTGYTRLEPTVGRQSRVSLSVELYLETHKTFSDPIWFMIKHPAASEYPLYGCIEIGSSLLSLFSLHLLEYEMITKMVRYNHILCHQSFALMHSCSFHETPLDFQFLLAIFKAANVIHERSIG